MATTLNFKNLIDVPEWRPMSVAPSASIDGQCLCSDLRNDVSANPYIWKLATTSTFEKYFPSNDEWVTPLAFTAVGGSIAAGAGIVFCPSHGPSGLVGGTPTTTSFTFAALPNSASIGINQLATQGDSIGYRIRVKANGAGHSGVTEERLVVANTAGTNPIVYLDSALSFTPTVTDSYELLSGRIYILGAGTTAAGFWKAYDIATQSISGNLSIVNLSATIGTDFNSIMMDELYTPYNRQPGEGLVSGGSTYNGVLYNCIKATAVGGTTITGSGMPAILANEFRNFQVRIVQDATNPTAVGQRRKITSHTAGVNGVFTVPAWTVNPSTAARFVVELNNDLIIWTNAVVTTYSYAAGGFAANAAWSTAAIAGGATQYANSGAAMGAGCCGEMAFSIVPDIARSSTNSHIYRFRGAGTTTLEEFDIAAGVNGVWTTISNYGGMLNTNLTTGTCSNPDAATNLGRYFYINVNGSQRMLRFDMLNRTLTPWAYLRFGQGTAVTGNKISTCTFIDGTTKVSLIYMLRNSGIELFNCLLQR